MPHLLANISTITLSSSQAIQSHPPRPQASCHEPCREKSTHPVKAVPLPQKPQPSRNGRKWHTLAEKTAFLPPAPHRKPQCKNRTQSGNLPNHANPVIKQITVQTTPHPVHPCKSKIGAPPMSLSQLRTQVNSIKRKLVRELRVVRARPRRRRLLPPLGRSRCPQETPARPFPSPQEPLQAHQATRKLRRRRPLPEPVPGTPPPALSRRHPLPPAARRGNLGLISYLIPDPVKY